MDVFNPGLFIIDRQNPEDDLINEPHKISLCWNQPQLLINLVDKAKNLSNLNLIGYEELTDLALVVIKIVKITFTNHSIIYQCLNVCRSTLLVKLKAVMG